MALSCCATCGVPIGGLKYNPVEGFTLVDRVKDLTRTGHILGQAKNRSEAPNRNLPSVQSCVLRLCLHLAMLQGAIQHQQVKSFARMLKAICMWQFTYYPLIDVVLHANSLWVFNIICNLNKTLFLSIMPTIENQLVGH